MSFNDYLCNTLSLQKKGVIMSKTKVINKVKKKKAIFQLFKPKVKVELRKGNLYKITVLSY